MTTHGLLSQSPDEEAVESYARSLLAHTREEVNRADSKASLLLAASGVGIGAILSTVLSGNWDPFSIPNSVEWMWWSGCATAVSAIIALGFAVFPRTRRKVYCNSMVAYFADVRRIPEADLKLALAATLSSSSSYTLDQLHRVSKIADTKYSLIRWSFFLFAYSIFACPTSVLLYAASR